MAEAFDAPPTDAEVSAAQNDAPPTPGEVVAAHLPQRLVQWAPHIAEAAQATVPHGVDVGQWGGDIAAVLDRESNGVNVAKGYDGHGHGLMQIDDRYHDFAKTPDVMDPRKNIAYGAGMLRDLFLKLPPDMPYDEKIQRAADAYNGGAKHLAADNPDSGTTGNDYGTDVLGRSRKYAAAELARVVANGPSSQDGARNLQLADATGLPPGVVAADPQAAQAKADAARLEDSLAAAPATAAFMRQSPDHAAVLKDEAHTFSWMERWFNGATHDAPNAAKPFANAGIDYPVEAQKIVDTPPVVTSAFHRVMQQWRYEYEALKLYGLQRTAAAEKAGPGLLPGELGDPALVQARADAKANAQPEEWDKKISNQAKVVQDWKSRSESQTVFEASSAQFPQHAIKMVGGLGPYLVAGEAAAPVLMAQTLGHLTADGVSPDHAMRAALVAGLAGTVGADKMTEGLATAAEVSGVQKLITDFVPQAWKAGQEFVEKVGRSAVNGWLMSASTSATERIAKIHDDAVRQGKEADPSEYAKAAKDALGDATAALPLLGLVGAAHASGRLLEAHAAAAAHDAATGPLRDSKVPDDTMRQVLRAQLETASPEQRTRFVDPEVFDRVMREEGLDPAEVATKVSGDGGKSYRFANQTGGLFAVPTENYLVDLRLFHDKLREGVAGEPDGATLSRDGAENVIKFTAPLTDEDVAKLYPNALRRMSDAEVAHHKEQTDLDVAQEFSIRGGMGAANDTTQGEPGKVISLRKELLLKNKPPENEPPAYGSTFAQKLYADMMVRSRPVDELRIARGTYASQASRAQTQIDKLSTKTTNLLASAEQNAQEGIDEALGAAEKGRDSSVSQATSSLVSVRRLTNEIRRIVTQGRMAGIDPTSISDDVAGMVNKAIKTAASKAVKDADVTPADVKKIVSEQVKQANAEYQSSLAGSRRAEDRSNKATAKTVYAGDNEQEIEKLKVRRDLNLQMADARTAALKRADVAQAGLKKMGDDGTRERIYDNKENGHPEYGWGYDLIMEATGLRKPDASYRPRDFKEVTDALVGGGEKLGFDADAIRQLVAQPKAPGSMTVDELANVHTAVKNLRHLAAEQRQAYVEGKLLDRQKLIATDVAPTVRAMVAAGRSPTRELLDKVAGEGKAKLDAAYSNFHTLLAQLGEWGKAQQSRFLEVRHAENLNYAKIDELFKTVTPELKKLGDEDVQHPAWMSDEAKALHGDMLKRRDVWYAVLRSGSHEGLSNLARGWGAEPTQVVSWLHSVANTPAEWDLFKRFWTTSEQFGDLEQAHDSNRSGLPMVRKTPRAILAPTGEIVRGGYAPERWHREGTAIPVVSPDDPTYGVNVRTDTEHGFIKPLTDHQLVPDIAFDNLFTHFRSLAKDVAMGDFVRDQARMLKDPMFQKATEPLGPDFYKALVNWHNVVASGHMQQTANTLADHAYLARARGYAARAIFSLNGKAVANVFGHLPFVKSVMGGDVDLSAGTTKALMPGWRQYALENSSVLQDRSTRWLQTLRDTERQVLGDKGVYRGAEIFRTPSLAMWHMADMQVGRTIFLGMREAAMQHGMTEAEANAHANLHTDRLMPPMDIYGKPTIANNQWIGAFVLARNFENTVWNAKAQLEIQQRLGIADGSKSGWSSYYGRMAGVAASLGLGYYAFGGSGRNADEQKNGVMGWTQYAGRSMIEHWTYGSYLSHTFAHTFASMMVGEGIPKRMDVFDTPEHQELTRFTNDLGKVVKNATANGSPSKALLAGLDAGGRLLGVSQPIQSGIGAVKVARYRIFDENDFKTTPHTYVGDAGKIWYGDVDSSRSNLMSDADKGLADLFDTLGRK